MTFMACAAMLASAVALNSCKSGDQNGPQEPVEVVKTEFAISIPDNAVGSPRRMPATTVQEGSFAGIDGIFLVPFTAKNATTKPIAAGSTRLDKNIHLSGAATAVDISATKKARLYSDVSIPLTTASFLFYAKSAATGKKFEVGSLVVTDTAQTTPSSFQFALDPVLTNASGLSAKQTALLAYLTSIANASDGTNAWYEYPTVHADSVGLNSMFEQYSSMHGLSTFEVQRVLTDLGKSLRPRYTTSAIAKAIIDSIAKPIWATVTSDVLTLGSPYDKFPSEYSLPEGSVDIKWNGTSHKFEEGTYSNMAALDRYVYPAQLWYYANSNIKTHNSSLKSVYEASPASWLSVLNAYTGPAAINTLTRSVAIIDTVQYAVARFDVQVKLNDSAALYMRDNSESVEGVRKDVPIPAEGLPVTAVLVGGQKPVKFDFTPIDGTDYYTIYDSVMTSAIKAQVHDPGATAYSSPNHTLVLETAANTNVNIAIELQNTTGVDFYGVSGQLIPKGSKFYVIAELGASAASETGNQVFKQDYKTTAKLKLVTLQNAYNTIPDLRTPQLEIGFAVDLTWQSGHEYEIPIP